MKGLLTAMQTALRSAASLSSLRDADIYITEDETEVPATLMYPAIELKDGQIRNKQQLSRKYVQSAQVQITIMQRVLQPDQSLMGTQGVLAIKDLVIAVLVSNKLGFESGDGQILNAFPAGEEPSRIFNNAEMKIQQKTIIFEYERHRIW